MLHRTGHRTIIAIALVAAFVSTAGCGRFVFTPTNGQTAVTLSPQQQMVMAQQTQQLQQRAVDLDRDNQELQTLLAQSRQQSQLLEEQLRATQTQLQDTANRLASIQVDNDQLRSRTTALAASVHTRNAAEIRANNSLLRSLTVSNMPGVNVRQDGDVVRIELPADQLFAPGTVQLKYEADALVRSVAADLSQNYPQQLIGIEGHTDSNPPTSPQFPTDQHLSVTQAMVVYDALVRSGGLQAKQLFVVGHGGKHPIVSNATDAGRARNRRIEVVVYPETTNR